MPATGGSCHHRAMQLLLIRHAESVNNRLLATCPDEYFDRRLEDPPLTDLGHEQAAKLADFIAAERIPRPDHMVTSLLTRAVQTAALVAGPHTPVEGNAHLHEVRWNAEPDAAPTPAHPGASAAELRAICPQVALPPEASDSGWYRGGFESAPDAWARAHGVIEPLRRRFGGSDAVVAVITHAWFMQYLLRASFGWSVPDGARGTFFIMSNTGHCLLSWPAAGPGGAEGPDGAEGPGGPRVRWLNRVDHLDAAQVTH